MKRDANNSDFFGTYKTFVTGLMVISFEIDMELWVSGGGMLRGRRVTIFGTKGSVCMYEYKGFVEPSDS